ncbi:hypothetical protein [Pseudaminobacter sp. NGMCC 1.201702]|uniref:hypothetical protein n=1 Tax=Pseudaminobacter sp. NGMCC 1.201702 TaxID=3391825 RepID=UPI0039EFC3D8
MPAFPHKLSSLIEQYMYSHDGRERAISTARAAKAIRTLMAVCPISGKELENAIAEAAIRHGHSVQFDLRELDEA